jgi:L-alanine-DL-glutamate epimerase-like enolase superfamily enzyme
VSPRVGSLEVSAYKIPLEEPESDGTFEWDATTVVVVELSAGNARGVGWTYGSAACGTLIDEILRDQVVGRDAMDIPGAWSAMVRAIRNQGRPGIASMSIAAVDIALWDLKARILDLPLADLFGRVRDAVPIYGSGGFTSMGKAELKGQLSGWVREGAGAVKIKIGRSPDDAGELERVDWAREAVGPGCALMVDANGAFSAKRAVRLSPALSDRGVVWFEEPVSSDDLDGMATVRRASEIEIAAGEYGYDVPYFHRLIPSIDVVQIDVSRCAGYSEWLRIAAVAGSFGRDVSGHCAQSLHVPVACSIQNLRHLEYFADHARADRILFDGVLDPAGGVLRPDPTRPGIGIELKRADAGRYAA